MTEQITALWIPYSESGVNSALTILKGISTAGPDDELLYFVLADQIVDQITDTVGDGWTYQFSLKYGPWPSDNGIILHFHNPDHALLFKLASDLHLEVIS